MDRNSTLRTAVVSWCSVVCTAVLLAADCSLLVPPTVFCCELGCVRAVFLCLLFLQIADVDVFFCVLLVICGGHHVQPW